MIVNKNVELMEKSAVKLTITVDKDSIQKEYDELLGGYSRSLQLKGFRRGKVPRELLVRKLGAALIGETESNVIHKSLEEALKGGEQRPLPYCVPEVDADQELKLGSDFTYTASFDTFPKVEVPEYKGLEVEELQVAISTQDEERELKALQEQNALVVDKKKDEVEKGDIVTIDYVELDAGGAESAGTKREGFVFELGSGYNLYKIDEDILGMRKEEERVIKKSYPQDFEIKELAGRMMDLKVKVRGLKEKQLPEINDELAQDISEKYSTLEDLKKDIRLRLEEFARRRVREHSISQLLERIAQGTQVELPKSMIEQDLERQWEDFVRRFRATEQDVLAALQKEGKSKEDLLKEWQGASERKLRLRLAVSRMVELEKIQVSEEEVDGEVRKTADARRLNFAELKEGMKKHNALDLVAYDLKNEKLYDLLLENAVKKKGKEIKFLDLAQGNY